MYTVGIDIGGTNIRIGLVDKEYNVSCFEKYSADSVSNAEMLAFFISDYISRHGVDGYIKAVCAGFPATVDKKHETVLSAPNLKGFDGVNVKKAVAKTLKYPFFIDKDVNLLVLCDLFRSKCDAKDIVACYVGTGLGNAIMIDGKLIAGHNGVAGELGHIPFGDTETACGCGNKGCAEPLVGGKFLEKIAAKMGVDIAELFVKHGETEAIGLYLDRLARVVAGEINILDPELLILGGGVIGMTGFPREKFVSAVRSYVRKPLPNDNLKVIFSQNASDCGVIGAGIRAWNER